MIAAAKYRKKPVVIEALRWEGSDESMAAFCPGAERMMHTTAYGNEVRAGSLLIATLEGDMKADPGDWIIRGVQGEFYPCKPDIFDATYERLPEEGERDEPAPSFSKTYRLADGELIGGEYGWVADLDHFDGCDGPVELTEETWTRTAVRTFWHLPTKLYSCGVNLDCDEDATTWVLTADGADQACDFHAKLYEVLRRG